MIANRHCDTSSLTSMMRGTKRQWTLFLGKLSLFAQLTTTKIPVFACSNICVRDNAAEISCESRSHDGWKRNLLLYFMLSFPAYLQEDILFLSRDIFGRSCEMWEGPSFPLCVLLFSILLTVLRGAMFVFFTQVA